MSTVAAPGAVTDQLSPVRRLIRQFAAIGCAGAVVGVVVAFPLGRLAMRLLAAANPGAAGMATDDGFAVGTVSLGGSAQLLLSVIQISMLGAVLYLPLRHLLIGPARFRIGTLSVGVATCVAALLAEPDGFDFTMLDPSWLPIALFWVLPFVATAAFAVLAERWLRPDAWFLRASDGAVSWTFLVWLLSGIGLVVALPFFLVAALAAVVLGRRPLPSAASEAGRWAARAALVAVFCLGLVDLVRDTQALV